MSNRQEIAAVLASKYGAEYVFMGRIFQSTIADQSCEIDIGIAVPNLVTVWDNAGQAKISLATRQQIDGHRQVIYLTSNATGYDACREIAQLAQVFLQIGGIAIKVESAGIAHEKQQWLEHYNSADVFAIYSLFVMLIEGEETYYSCGMSNFSKADVTLDVTEDLGLAIYVMNVFNYYRLTESPILQDGHTFQPDIECPTYQMKWKADGESEPDSPLYNPHGRWYLSRKSIVIDYSVDD
ncbi:MAG: hypothetical protein AAGA16_06620 [Cyanobacteria bacterium P01_E01_bin.35]